jgi:alpha-N-arabinofuranosidase
MQPSRRRFTRSTALAVCSLLLVSKAFAQPVPSTPPAATAAAPAPVPTIHLQADKVTAKVSPLLFGLMTEDINYGLEGGLYGELLVNRSFQDTDANEYWDLVKGPTAAGNLSLDSAQPLNAAHPASLKIEVTTAVAGQRFGVANEGYWGIPVKPSTKYRASFYAKAAPGFAGPLTVSIESNDGATVFASAQVKKITGDWQQYTVTLTTDRAVKPSTTNRFAIVATGPGTVWLNLASLFPPTWNDRPNGLRPDLMKLMADLKPGFLRFPGGNYLEGNAIANRFDWKKTVGPVVDRPGHQNDGWGYRSSDGLGLLEYLQWCEDIKMEPLLAVYAAYSMREGPTPEIDPYVQDALDEIEYVTGDASTKWGAQRIKDGHKAPFTLHYVEIGNEDGQTGNARSTYNARFAKFYDAIKAKYPSLQLIATIPVQGRTPDLVDDHNYYSSSVSAERAATRYDKTSRTGPKVLFGEYATQTGGYQNNQRPETSNLDNALGDAAFLTGLERNSDVVLMSSYAPLFINLNPGGSQWRTDLIGYDGLNSFGSVSYYAQKMFSTLHGDSVLAATADDVPVVTVAAQGGGRRGGGGPGAPQKVPSLFYSVTRDTRKGTIFLNVVNTAAAPQPVNVEIAGAKSVAAGGTATVLTSASLTDGNSLAEPTKVSPATSSVKGLGPTFTREFPPHSFTVLQIEAR